jgi:hypothetical protein
MSNERILDKIRKCLALANDSRGNPTECENAMRQAQALMAKHGVSELDIDAAQVTTLAVRSRVSVKNAARWEVAMMHKICAMYGLHNPMWASGGPEPTNKGWWFFIGSKAYTEVAHYTYDVLYRQILAARNEFVKTLNYASRGEKSELANSFCEGWVYQVGKNLSKMNDPDGVMAKRIAAYLEKNNLNDLPRADAHDACKKLDSNAFHAGVDIAKDVRVNTAAGNSMQDTLRLS